MEFCCGMGTTAMPSWKPDLNALTVTGPAGTCVKTAWPLPSVVNGLFGWTPFVPVGRSWLALSSSATSAPGIAGPFAPLMDWNTPTVSGPGWP